MSLAVPHHWEPQIELVAQAQRITTDEALDRILQAGLERLISPDAQARRSNASFFGEVKGPGAHGSPEAVDHYIEGLRNQWGASKGTASTWMPTPSSML